MRKLIDFQTDKAEAQTDMSVWSSVRQFVFRGNLSQCCKNESLFLRMVNFKPRHSAKQNLPIFLDLGKMIFY